MLESAADPKIARAYEILSRRPRLAEVLIAVADMSEGRRNCRLSMDVSDGIIRIFREVQERSVSLIDPAPLPPAG